METTPEGRQFEILLQRELGGDLHRPRRAGDTLNGLPRFGARPSRGCWPRRAVRSSAAGHGCAGVARTGEGAVRQVLPCVPAEGQRTPADEGAGALDDVRSHVSRWREIRNRMPGNRLDRTREKRDGPAYSPYPLGCGSCPRRGALRVNGLLYSASNPT